MPKGTCSVDGCERPHYGRGWCKMHYKRWRDHGSSEWHPPTEAERFWAKVDKSAGPDGCWLWTGSRHPYGHGRFYSGNQRMVGAHVWAWESVNGPVPAGLMLDHFRCDNPPCCNPAHVRPVTSRENILRGNSFSSHKRAQTECINGHPFDDVNTYLRPDTGTRQCKQCVFNRKVAVLDRPVEFP